METQIKDSGLTCPFCGYNLTALTSNRCPECGQVFVLAKPASFASYRSLVSNSMPCPDCGFSNTDFMPQKCGQCGHPFTWLQRIFGVGGRLG